MGERLRGSRRGVLWRVTRSGRTFKVVASLAALVTAFGLGRLSAAGNDRTVSASTIPPGLALVQDSRRPADPRELIPLPLPGQPDEQGQQVPGQQGQTECPLYFFEDGQFFQLRPGEPGSPGPFGQGTPELFPLDPLPGAPAPDRPVTPQPEPPPPRPPPPFFSAPGVAEAGLSAPQILASSRRDPDSSSRRTPRVPANQGGKAGG